MNWEDRLKKARAQREAILKAREAEALQERLTPRQSTSSPSVLEAPRNRDAYRELQTRHEPKPDTRSGRTRFSHITLSFLAGLCLGVAAMGLAGPWQISQLFSSAEESMRTAGREVLNAAPTVPLPESHEPVPEAEEDVSLDGDREPQTLDFEDQPSIEISFSPTLQTSMPQTFGHEILLAGAANAPRVSVVAFDDNAQIENVSRLALQTPLPDLPPSVGFTPPVQMIPGGENIRVWIFTPSEVDQERLESVRRTLSMFKLPIQDVYTVDFTVSETQVRFYDETSSDAARRLAEEIGANARDFTDLETELLPGGLEIYLAGNASGAPSPSPSSN